MTAGLVLLALLGADEGRVVLVLPPDADPQRAALDRAIREVGLAPVVADPAARARSPEIREAAAALAQVQQLAEAGRRAFYAARFDSTRELAAQAEEAAGPWRAHPHVRALLTELLLIRDAAGERGALQRAAALMPSFVPSEKQFAPSLRRAWAKAVAGPRSKQAQFTLALSPPNAAVWLDGAPVDAAGPVTATAGPVDVYAQAPGHAPVALRLVPADGAVLRVSLRPVDACADELAWRVAQRVAVEPREVSACAEALAARAVVVGSGEQWTVAGPCVTARERRVTDPAKAVELVTELADEAAEDCRLSHDAPTAASGARLSWRVRLGSRLERVELLARASDGPWQRQSCRVPCDQVGVLLPADWRALEYALSGYVGDVAVTALGTEDAPLRLGSLRDPARTTPWIVAGVVGGVLTTAAIVVGVVFAAQPRPSRIVLAGAAP